MSILPGDNIEIMREFIKWIRLKSICANYLDPIQSGWVNKLTLHDGT